MKRTRSKLDLSKLQSQFDDLLEELTSDDIDSWKQHDLAIQERLLLDGKVIDEG